MIDEPLLRITSIDLGTRIEITDLQDLLDYNRVGGEFSLAKAALALTAFSEQAAAWKKGATLADMLRHFGGGIELTTLAAVPKGSGLGTSSIVGAVILSVVQRVMGRRLTQRDLFHGVLRLEQALTSGGGWQDQVGGAVDGVKVITTGPGLLPDARIHYVPADVLDPRRNGGCTLLYYTGITRVAKNILRQVVGRYLDRDRPALATLRKLRRCPRAWPTRWRGRTWPPSANGSTPPGGSTSSSTPTPPHPRSRRCSTASAGTCTAPSSSAPAAAGSCCSCASPAGTRRRYAGCWPRTRPTTAPASSASGSAGRGWR